MADHDQNLPPASEPHGSVEADPRNATTDKSTIKRPKTTASGVASKPRRFKPTGNPKKKTGAGKRVKRDAAKDDRFTHPLVVQAVEHSFGPIDFDPCWHPASAIRPLAHLDFRKGQDGLRDPWHGQVVFVNPPWSAAKRFLERSYDQWKRGNVQKVICLVPSNTDTTLFHTTLKAEADVYFVMKRMRFFKEDGSPYVSAQAVMIVIFGATLLDRLRFEARLPGSWWMPYGSRIRYFRDPTVLFAANDRHFCSSPGWLDGHQGVALCRRFASEG